MGCERQECPSRRWFCQCPLWVKSGHLQCKKACPLYPRKRHQMRQNGMSALPPKADTRVQNTNASFCDRGHSETRRTKLARGQFESVALSKNQKEPTTFASKDDTEARIAQKRTVIPAH